MLWRNDVDGAGLHRGVCHVVSRIGNGGGRTGAGGRDVRCEANFSPLFRRRESIGWCHIN